MLFEELEKPWTIKTVSVSAIDEEASSGEGFSERDWKHPTVGWLSDWNHFQPSNLPQMKVPSGPGNGVYDSPDDYFDVTIKLWIGMTFVDGNNALLPHCTAKVNDKVCEQPLWLYSRRCMALAVAPSRVDKWLRSCAPIQGTSLGFAAPALRNGWSFCVAPLQSIVDAHL